MRYWLISNRGYQGPKKAEQIALLGQEDLLCPEGRDPSHAENWAPACHFPEVLIDLASPGGQRQAEAAAPLPPREEAAAPASGRKPWVLALLLIIGASVKGIPTGQAPATAPTREAMTSETLVQGLLLLCKGKAVPVLRSDLAVFVADGGYRVHWTPQGAGGGGELRFEYDPVVGQIRPLNEEARRLLEGKAACP